MNSSKIMTTGDVQKTALRLPRPLHEQILQAAAANNRSMNAEIVERLSASFVQEEEFPIGRLSREQQDTLKLLLEKLLPR